MSGDFFNGDLVRHERFGLGRIEETSGYGESQKCRVWFPRSDRTTYLGREQLAPLSESESAAYEMVRLAVRELREEELPAVDLADRWKGGELVIKPADPELQPKTIPVETFFHKIVMVRDRLRVMEQQINSHKGLSEADRVALQQYITRSYGSLTTFNVLFKNREDYFSGQKKG